jgi:hypothetical protein
VKIFVTQIGHSLRLASSMEEATYPTILAESKRYFITERMN